VDDLCGIETYLDFIAITGDLTEDGKLESYQGLKELLSVISVPVLVIPGNHDSREPFREVFPPLAHHGNTERLDYCRDLGDTRVIGIDSVDDGKTTGKLMPAQLSWLRTSLTKEPSPVHTIVMVHHPPFSTGRSEFDALSNLDCAAELANILSKQSSVTLLCGHVHRPYQVDWAGAACFIAGSPSCQLSADPPFGDAPLRLVDEPYTYFLHSLDSNGDRIVSTRYVNP
ncbi:MAG: metallophosphoesterase, partial [Granulosicoccus sp.]